MSALSNFRFVDTGPRLGERGYAFRLPRPTSSEFLYGTAITFNRVIGASGNPVHLLAIANSGVPLATALLMYRFAKLDEPDDWLSIIDPTRLELIPEIDALGVTSILVDNSINSGETLLNILNKLRASGVIVSTLVKLVDYEDEIERKDHDLVRQHTGIRIFSLYRARDILASFDAVRRMDAEKAIVRAHERPWGSKGHGAAI